jgi:hypothetical protein
MLTEFGTYAGVGVGRDVDGNRLTMTPKQDAEFRRRIAVIDSKRPARVGKPRKLYISRQNAINSMKYLRGDFDKKGSLESILSLTELGFHKTAGSDLTLLSGGGKKLFVDREYHYRAQGKYTSPILRGPSKAWKGITSDHPKLNSYNSAYYVAPMQAKAHLNVYEKSVDDGISTSFTGVEKKVQRKKFLGLIPYKKKTKQVITDTAGMSAYRKSPKFKNEHKRVTDFMRAHGAKGYFVEVG